MFNRCPSVVLAMIATVWLVRAVIGASAPTDSLGSLSTDFWAWRAKCQPFSQDDIPRLDHSAGKRSWSAASIASQRNKLRLFHIRWAGLASKSAPVSEQVDYQLLGSALARVHWELDINPRWEKDPTFYIDQTLGAVLDALLEPPPFTEKRSEQILERVQNIPAIFEEGRANLHPARPFAELAIGELADVGSKLKATSKALGPLLHSETVRSNLPPATDRAIQAAEDFRRWLQQKLSGMPKESVVGRQAYRYFLQNVAVMPYTPEQLILMSRQEWARSVAFEQFEKQKNVGRPELDIASSLEQQDQKTEEQERAIRSFLVSKGLLTVPSNVRHYRALPIPAYLQPLSGFGELDDFTSPSRLTAPGVRWTPAPSLKLGYFALASAKDPRPIIVHEGVPGHYFQLCLSWMHEDPIRRHYYDSGANEGLGFYAEDMMLQAGLFDESPRTREMIYNFMRLRALRVEVDVKLALGEFTIDQAADYLMRSVPMDKETAQDEARFFASTPGQAISYQIGKIQILRFLADARTQQGPQFRLQAFHDALWKNGNVPIALQRWEYLGNKDEVPAPEQR